MRLDALQAPTGAGGPVCDRVPEEGPGCTAGCRTRATPRRAGRAPGTDITASPGACRPAPSLRDAAAAVAHAVTPGHHAGPTSDAARARRTTSLVHLNCRTACARHARFPLPNTLKRDRLAYRGPKSASGGGID